jgi:RNA polymerase sigma factor (TIGR02999 family)
MTDVPRFLEQIGDGDPTAAEALLPLVYEELRRLASARLAQEMPGQTLQATALVHEAYLRLVGGAPSRAWDSRGHFFAAAAEAMRRILIENARRKKQSRRGGDLQRVDFEDADAASSVTPEQLVAIDDALSILESQDSRAAQVFKLRYFAGCSVDEAAQLLEISRATAFRHWAFARAWLLSRLAPDE